MLADVSSEEREFTSRRETHVSGWENVLYPGGFLNSIF